MKTKNSQKLSLFFLLFFIFSGNIFAQNYFSYLTAGKKLYFGLAKDRIYVKFNEQSSQATRKAVLAQFSPNSLTQNTFNSAEFLNLPFSQKTQKMSEQKFLPLY